MRDAVVIACRVRPQSLTTESGVAIKQRVLCRHERKFKTEIPSSDHGLQFRPSIFKRPVIDPRVCIARFSARQRKALTCDALIVLQPPAPRIRECGMRDQKLARCESARIVLSNSWSRSKKSDLESERIA